jgi:DNA-binding response OmpR family regulator
VVILDIMMPAVSGLELSQAMRADPQLARTPVLMLTARGLPDDEAVALRWGADHFLTKPFLSQDLLAAVESLLRSNHAK